MCNSIQVIPSSLNKVLQELPFSVLCAGNMNGLISVGGCVSRHLPVGYQCHGVCVIECISNAVKCCAVQYIQMSDYWNQSHRSITGSRHLMTYAHDYCHGCQKLENWNLHWIYGIYRIILHTY